MGRSGIIFPSTIVDLLQACFGVPGVEKVESEVCDHCVLHTLCRKSRDVTLQKVKAVTGEEDPVAANKRAAQRERTRKCRARKTLQAIS